MVVKVLFYGTHSTGKSSLLKAVERELGILDPPIPFGTVEEQSREIVHIGAKYGISRKELIDEGTTREAQEAIFFGHLSEELKLTTIFSSKSRRNGISRVILCDRGPDNLAYYQRNVGSIPSYLDKLVKEHMEKYPYTVAFRVPITGKLVNDGERDSDNFKYQSEISERIDDLFDNKWYSYLYKTKIIKLESPKKPKREDWTEVVIEQLKLYIPELKRGKY